MIADEFYYRQIVHPRIACKQHLLTLLIKRWYYPGWALTCNNLCNNLNWFIR